ncbi:MAG: hypothetical protein IKE70_01175, partial [Bacilli bacterium]|nr:hypothetical protein [Bacilli bacterium]
MAINEEEFLKERKILKKVGKLLDKRLEEYGVGVIEGEDDLLEFKKMMWENSSSFDLGESSQVMVSTELEENKLLEKQKYYKRLKRIDQNPYFASIVFRDDEDGMIYNIYMSLTYLKDDDSNNILYDWRSPICSLFYDYEVGPCSYSAPGG